MYKHKDLLGLREMTQEEILYILDTAAGLKDKIGDPGARGRSLEKANVITMFYEDSTRTKMSFTAAGKYLGAMVTDLGVATSSVNKGETLVDTGKNLDSMGTDIIVIRHGMSGAPHLLARNIRAGVVNAGDGINEHPTQALLDLYTIREKLGGFAGLKVAVIGDIAHSRVARSNVFGLTKLGAAVVLAGPATLLSGNMALLGINITVTSDIKMAVSDSDVVMGLRVQLERQAGKGFPGLSEYASLYGINDGLLKYAKKGALVMHPGPINRGVELTADVINSTQSVIYEQARNGVAVRMAILTVLFGNRGTPNG